MLEVISALVSFVGTIVVAFGVAFGMAEWTERRTRSDARAAEAFWTTFLFVLALLSVVWAGAVWAQPHPGRWSVAADRPEVQFDAAPPGGALVGVIHFTNKLGGSGHVVHEVETPEGIISLRQFISGNHGLHCCDDTLEAWDVPQGLLLRPNHVQVPEGGEAFIEVIRWVGG